MTASTLENQRLQEILAACVRVRKSDLGDFSAKWLRLARVRFSGRDLTRLCDLGCLSFQANGTEGQGRRWYTVVRDTLPD